MLFREHPVGDGLYTGLLALQQALSEHARLSAAFSGFDLLPRQTGKLKVAARPPLGEVGPLEAARQAGESRLGTHGRVFLRYSGTEPVLRLLVEGEDAREVRAVMQSVHEAAAQALT